MNRALLFDINHSEYGITSTGSNLDRNTNIYFQPSEFGILNKYNTIKELYKVQLSPTVVSLTTHVETN